MATTAACACRRGWHRRRWSWCSCGARTAPARWPSGSPPSCAAAGVRAQLDAATEQSFGRRVTDWELRGVPVRIEVGPRDLAQGIVTVVRRDDGSKSAVAVEAVVAGVPGLLETIQDDLLAAATQAREAATADAATDRRGGRGGRDRVRPGALADARGRRRRGPPPRARRHRAGAPTARRHPAGRARTSPTPSPWSPARTDPGGRARGGGRRGWRLRAGSGRGPLESLRPELPSWSKAWAVPTPFA